MATKWRLLIGPYFADYAWYTHHYVDLVDLAYQTTLTSAMTVGVTVNLNLASGASFPSAGGVWVGPTATGEGWEYVAYTGKSVNVLSGTRRETSAMRDHNGNHGVGAAVKVWYPVLTASDGLTFTETYDETLSVLTWQATVSGFLFPQHVLRNNHVCVVQIDYGLGAGWEIYLLGFLDSPSATDDHAHKSTWTVNIRTVDNLLKAKVKALRIGGLDIAKEGTATGSTPLVLAFDERASGDYTAAAPSFDASQVLDRDTKTLWIAERYMGSEIVYNFPNDDSENQGGQKFDQVYINPPPGTPPGGRWIQLVQTANRFSFQGMAINMARPGAGSGNTDIWQLHAGDVSTNDLIILCEDEAVFRQLNPLASPAITLEVPDSTTFSFANLLPAGGQLWMRLGELNMWLANMIWGTGNGFISHPDAPSGHHYTPSITVPGVGETMRYLHALTAAGPAAYWTTSMVKTAGYRVNNHPAQWIAVELPGFGLKLTESITATVPGAGATLKISDDAGPSNSGLPASGILRIGDEEISYSAKVEGGVTITARHATGTTAAIHEKDDAVFLMYSIAPIDAHLLSSVGWRRYGGTIYPARFKFYRSIMQSPRTPDSDNWENDWALVDDVTGHTTSTYDYTFSPPDRCRHIMFTVSNMTTDPARVRLNEIVATIDNSAYDTSLWLTNGVRAAQVMSQLISNAGLPGASILTEIDTSTALYDQTTADDAAWSVIADLAEFAGCTVVVNRDSQIYTYNNDLWTVEPLTVNSAWDKTTAADIQVNLRNGIGVSQVKLAWRTPDSTTKGTEVYPAVDAGFGQALETKELIYATNTAAQAAAKKRYIQGRYPFEATVTLAPGVPALRPGDIDTVTWQYNQAGGTITRLFLVKAVEHTLQGGTWSTKLQMIQVDREAEY